MISSVNFLYSIRRLFKQISKISCSNHIIYMNVIEFLLIESKTSSCINNSNVARSWKGFDHILISEVLTF